MDRRLVSVPWRFARYGDAAVASASLSNELGAAEARATAAERKAHALQVEVDGLTSQLQKVILGKKEEAERSKVPFSSPSFGFGRKR